MARVPLWSVSADEADLLRLSMFNSYLCMNMSTSRSPGSSPRLRGVEFALGLLNTLGELESGGCAGQPDQPLVTAATYLPSGPLSSLTLGNGLTEPRSYTNRYFPSSIVAGSHLSWSYSTDAVGNIFSITNTLNAANNRTYAYQDYQYFLTSGNGPWGPRAWAYRIGNRAAGNQITAAAVTGEGSGRTSFLDYSAESRLSRLATSNGPSSTELLYDGRGYLRRSRLTATNTSDFEQTEPVYNSEGLLLARRYHKQSTRGGRGDTGAPPTSQVVVETAYIFYFAGRPVAQLTRPQAGGRADTLLYLTTDHLGTPIQATDTAGAIVWEGGLDPFGTPFVFPRGEVPPEGGDRDTMVAGLSKSVSATHGERGYLPSLPRAVG